jgi:hypothetical protein
MVGSLAQLALKRCSLRVAGATSPLRRRKHTLPLSSVSSKRLRS